MTKPKAPGAMTTDAWLGSSSLMREWFKDASWSAWTAFSKALWGEPLSPAELQVYRERTGRTTAPTRQAREAWVAVGRRGGKSIVMAREGVRLAVRDYSSILKPGARAFVVVLAADREQAAEVMSYILGFFENIPALAAMVEKKKGGKASTRRDEVRLTNRVTIRVAVASFRKIRGRTIVAAILDEIAYWYDGERSANPSEEILRALRPAMLTVTAPLLLVISSPYRRTGPLWEAVKKFWAKDGPVLVWRGDTLSMNPSADRAEIDRAFEDDPVAAASEYGRDGDVSFRTDLESFISPEAVEAATVRGRAFLAFDPRFRHVAGVDVAGGSGQDEFALSIVRRERGRAVLCLTRSWKPPFSPDLVTEAACAVLKEYGLHRVVGDNYANEWPVDRFKASGVAYVKADRTRSEFYQAMLPVINSRRVELLDDARTNGQLLALERSTSKLGRDSIGHPPNGKDDRINAVAIAVVLAIRREMLAHEGEGERARQTAASPTLDQFGAFQEVRRDPATGVLVMWRVFPATGRAIPQGPVEETEVLHHGFIHCGKCKGSHLAIPGQEPVCPADEIWTPTELMRAAVKPESHPDVRLVEEGYANNIDRLARTIGWTG